MAGMEAGGEHSEPSLGDASTQGALFCWQATRSNGRGPQLLPRSSSLITLHDEGDSFISVLSSQVGPDPASNGFAKPRSPRPPSWSKISLALCSQCPLEPRSKDANGPSWPFSVSLLPLELGVGNGIPTGFQTLCQGRPQMQFPCNVCYILFHKR